MTLRLSTAVRNARLDAIDDQYNGGTPPAIIEIRTGAPPTNLTDPDSGTLLATLTFGNPAFAAAASGVLQENAITADPSADASGTPGHFREKQGGTGTVLAQGTCAVGGGDLNFNAAVSLGGTVSITDHAITDGNA
jgi:hypothetical protein